MSELHDLFAARVNSILDGFSGRTLVFFKGFASAQLQQLIGHPQALLNKPSLLRDGYLNVEVLNDSWIDLAAAVKGADRPLAGFYEELLALEPFLSRIEVEQIVVVENNILSPWVPSCFPYDLALRLFDFWQGEQEPREKLLTSLTQYYGDVKLLNGGEALLLPVPLDDGRITTLPFWTGDPELEEPDPEVEQIEAGSQRDWEYCLALSKGDCSPALLLYSGEQPGPRHRALLCAAGLLGVSVCLDEIELYREKFTYNDSQFVPILQKYWGARASFRPLLFYRDPDRSRETEVLSQGQIIAEIVDQCETAMNDEPFSNIFITAPTGSGKSILFQIPALYLAERYGLVTIVVSPLIALMNDQVDQLRRERGVTIAACINSAMSMEERGDTVAQVQAGRISLLYLAPELLLTTHLQTFLGGRRIGLVVIDEAHTVTSWGRDFRSDYWFLGDFLKKNAREGLVFPVLCLTATAVYSGEDDVVNDTILELGLEKTILHLGSVRRDNIAFDIQRHDPDRGEAGKDEQKTALLMQRMREYTARGEKVLAYFPFKSQVDQIYNQISVADRVKLRRYHGQISSAERKLVERDYKSGTAMGLFCTKAFGMGIDVGDIRHVVHFAPTGALSDYVQEIGRAARDPSIQGVAHIDFFPGDLRYVRTLNGISELRQYQLREMLKKLCAICRAKGRRNLLISAETFEYLFQESDVENRTKSGLMLLAKDLSNKYTFPVLIVRPKAMLSKNYVTVPSEIEKEFLRRYGRYAKLQEEVSCRTVSTGKPGRASEMTVYSAGRTFLVDMAAIWENCYPDRAFGMFKKEFFETGIQIYGSTYRISPRVRVEIRYADEYACAASRLEKVVTAVTELFRSYKSSSAKQFTQHQFEEDLAEALGERVIRHDKAGLLLDIFTETVNEDAAYLQSRSQVRVLRKRKQPGLEESAYFVSSPAYARLSSYFVRQLEQCRPNDGDSAFFRFYPLTQNKQIEIMPLLRLMELLDLASYEVRGGEKAEVFIRINDPAKLERLAAGGKYTNGVLQAIRERHRNSERLMAAFFTTDMTTQERWELIEQYFLGNEAFVRQTLGLAD